SKVICITIIIAFTVSATATDSVNQTDNSTLADFSATEGTEHSVSAIAVLNVGNVSESTTNIIESDANVSTVTVSTDTIRNDDSSVLDSTEAAVIENNTFNEQNSNTKTQEELLDSDTKGEVEQLP